MFPPHLPIFYSNLIEQNQFQDSIMLKWREQGWYLSIHIDLLMNQTELCNGTPENSQDHTMLNCCQLHPWVWGYWTGITPRYTLFESSGSFSQTTHWSLTHLDWVPFRHGCCWKPLHLRCQTNKTLARSFQRISSWPRIARRNGFFPLNSRIS